MIHQEITYYPYILYPRQIEAIRSGSPIIPAPQLIPVPNPPKIPPEPPDPESLTPPRRIPTFTMMGAAMLAVVLASILGGNNFLALLLSLWSGIVIGGALYAATYPKRLKRYRKRVEEARQSHARWEQERNRQNQSYQGETQRVQLENERRLQQHERARRELSLPENLERWRRQETARALGQLQPSELGTEVDITEFDPRGYAEYSDNCRFPILLERYFKGNISVLRYFGENNRIPDFAYVDRSRNLFIDIEIDEPYTPRQYPRSNGTLKETHCIDQSHYDERDREWTKCDWFVIHFSERQVIAQGQSCCKIIARLISDLTGDTTVLQPFANVQDLTLEPRWTIEEAREMANRRERLYYHE